MPRDGSGVYTLPPGNPVVTGTVIASPWANSTMSDIAAQLNNVLTRDGLLGPISPFLLTDGTVSAPGLAFASEPGLGWYREGSAKIAVAGVNAKQMGIDLSVATAPAVGMWPRALGGSGLTLFDSPSGSANSSSLALSITQTGILIASNKTGTGPKQPIVFDGPVYGVSEPNLLVNSPININQRNAPASGSVGNAVYLLDMWRGGAAGGTYAVTAGPGGVPYNQINITAGAIGQVVVAGNVVGGDYVLSWKGTATARFGGSGFLASPVRVTGVPGNANLICEWQGGTMYEPKLERGKNPTPWVQPEFFDNYLACQAYYLSFSYTGGGYGTGANSVAFTIPLAIPLRANPLLANAASGAGSGNVGVQNGGTLFTGSIVTNSISLWSLTPTCLGLSIPFGGAGGAMPATVSILGSANASP